MIHFVPHVSKLMHWIVQWRLYLEIYFLPCLTASAAATSLSLGKMGGSGPMGVMLCIPQSKVSIHPSLSHSANHRQG